MASFIERLLYAVAVGAGTQACVGQAQPFSLRTDVLMGLLLSPPRARGSARSWGWSRVWTWGCGSGAGRAAERRGLGGGQNWARSWPCSLGGLSFPTCGSEPPRSAYPPGRGWDDPRLAWARLAARAEPSGLGPGCWPWEPQSHWLPPILGGWGLGETGSLPPMESGAELAFTSGPCLWQPPTDRPVDPTALPGRPSLLPWALERTLHSLPFPWQQSGSRGCGEHVGVSVCTRPQTRAHGRVLPAQACRSATRLLCCRTRGREGRTSH